MVYMLLPVDSWPSGHGAGMAMPGMSQGATAGNPALTLVLVLFMLGYVLWATDQLTSLARARTARPERGTAWDHPAHGAVLAPRLAACYKVMMGMTMGYMLVTML